MLSNIEQIAKTLKQKQAALVEQFFKGRAPDFLNVHARILDDYFHDSFEASRIGPRIGLDKNPYAIIALGGYGRQEQCRHSDVDLLILFQKKIPREAKELTQELVYPLWDIGLEVGYAIRHLNECIKMARTDFEVLTPLLDARFICGMSLLYTQLTEKLHQSVIQPKSRAIIDWLIASNQARHIRFGDSSYLLEPNLKEGQGGLRDYHTMLWIARIVANLKQPRDLEYYGYLSHNEFQQLQQALDFIWNVRNRLHHQIGRKYDQLHFENQLDLAAALQYRRKNGQKGVELFLGDLHREMEFIKQQLRMFMFELGYTGKAKYKTKHLKQTPVAGLQIVEGALNFKSLEAVLENPVLLITIFTESNRLKLPLNMEAKRIISEFGYLMDEKLRNAPEVVKAFERILLTGTPAIDVLQEMLNTGFLIRFIPEMKEIANRIQYDEYHLFPVDIHLLRTVQAIQKFGTPEDDMNDPFYGQIKRELKNRKPLLWAALLHDIGKSAEGGSHSEKGAKIVRRIMEAKGYGADMIDTVAFLTREHLRLIKTATRRDINAEETSLICARKIESTERLKMLYLLTVADSLSTGPNAWSNWTATLLRDLFIKILKILEEGKLASHEVVHQIEEKRTRVLAASATPDEKAAADALFDAMTPRYLLVAEPEDILRDMAIYRRVGKDEFAWQVFSDPQKETRQVRICARDRPGLFAKLAGVFTLNGLNILDAQIFTWRNQMALDVFELKPPPDLILESETWKRAETQMAEALTGRLDLESALQEKMAAYRRALPPYGTRPTRVEIDNQSSSFFTIIEVVTYDYLGLLYTITDAIFRSGLDIWVALISTEVDQVVDVFYVRDLEGQKIDSPEQEAAVKADIEAVLNPETIYVMEA